MNLTTVETTVLTHCATKHYPFWPVQISLNHCNILLLCVPSLLCSVAGTPASWRGRYKT